MNEDVVAAAVALAAPLIAQQEGLSLRPYRCPAGLSTIGFGHVIRDAAGKPMSLDAAQARYAQPISREMADQFLRDDITAVASGVLRLVTVRLTADQLGALLSFTYNVGVGRLRDSTLLKRLNRGDYQGVPSEMARFVYANGVRLEGLERRRAAEAALWWRGLSGTPA